MLTLLLLLRCLPQGPAPGLPASPAAVAAVLSTWHLALDLRTTTQTMGTACAIETIQ